jgi:hypothetical protein
MSEQPTRTVPVWVFSVVIVAVAAVAAGVAWFLASSRPVSTPTGPSTPATTTVTAPTTTTVVTTSAVATTATPMSDDATKAAAATTVRQLTYIKGVSGSASKGYMLKLDYLSDLSGTKAGEAYAKAHGDEWPPPNDYYFVNQSTKIRTLAASPTIKITMTSPDGSTKLKASVAQLRTHLSASGDTTYSGAPFYWVTIVGGSTVTKIVQQWVP